MNTKHLNTLSDLIDDSEFKFPTTNSWDDFEYPIRLEYQKPNGAWHLFYIAETAEECKYRLAAFGLATNTLFQQIRVTEQNGNVPLQMSKELLEQLNTLYRIDVKAAMQPLSQFADTTPEAAIETAMELIQGGLAAQHFVIPPNAAVTFQHPVISTIHLQEFEDSAIARIHITPDPEHNAGPTITFWKDGNTLDLKGYDPDVIPETPCQPMKDGPGFAFSPFEVNPRVKGFLILLCATIIRDFWVLDKRTRNTQYKTHIQKHRTRTGTGKQRKLVTTKSFTYIPRFQYNLETYHVNKTIQRETRVKLSPHLVSGHIRRLPDGWNPSETAHEHATEFGITLGPGQTFVRPHKRGELEQLRTYRSKSALDMLFGKE